MSLAPLLDASLFVQVHALAAVAALALGLGQFALPKGNGHHRLLGWIWVGLMALVAGSAFGIRAARPWLGSFGPIHLLAIMTLAALPSAVIHARRRRVRSHRIAMTILFVSALGLTGAFTLLPGRIMHQVLFGP